MAPGSSRNSQQAHGSNSTTNLASPQSNSIDFFLQPLSFGLHHASGSGSGHGSMGMSRGSLQAKLNGRLSKRVLSEHDEKGVLWLWDFSPVTNDLGRDESQLPRIDEPPSLLSRRSNEVSLLSSHKSPSKKSTKRASSYLNTQEERLRRCRVGSSFVRKLEKPIFESEREEVFRLPRQHPAHDSTSDPIPAHEHTSHAHHHDHPQAASFFKGIVDAKAAFRMRKKDQASAEGHHTASTPEDSLAMLLAAHDLTGFMSQHSTPAPMGSKPTSKHSFTNPANPPSATDSPSFLSNHLSSYETDFISKFGTIQHAKDCPILQGTKLAQEMPLMTTVHVKLHSWSDIVRISRLQKQNDWEKYLSSRERDRECVLQQSNELAEVCARAMKAAHDWRCDRITGITNPKKKKSLWRGPARRYRKKLNAHNRRKEFFQYMVSKCMKDYGTPAGVVGLQSRQEESRRKIQWALHLLRQYMLEEWDVDAKLFFHFCETFGYSSNMDYKLMFFFDRFARYCGVSSQQMREYKQAHDEGRLSVWRHLKKHYELDENQVQQFVPKKEKALSEFEEDNKWDEFFVTSGQKGFLPPI